MNLRVLVGAAIAVALVGCGPAEVTAEPTAPTTAPTANESVAALDALLGPWRPRGLLVPDDIVEAVRTACVDAASPVYSFELSDQPVVVADGRGLGIVTVIMADEVAAFECRAQLTGDGAVATDAPSRLDPAAMAQPEEDGIVAVSHSRLDEDAGSRTVLVGRIGPKASLVLVGFNDESEVEATDDNGWFVAWWPGSDKPGSIAATDPRRLVLDGVDDPAREIEGRVAPASWWIDAEAPALSPDSSVVNAILSELACASGQSPEGRILEPVIFSSTDGVLVTFLVRRRPGGQDCPSNPEFALEFTLPEPLGERRLLDGSEIPPRDATVPAN